MPATSSRGGPSTTVIPTSTVPLTAARFPGRTSTDRKRRRPKMRACVSSSLSGLKGSPSRNAIAHRDLITACVDDGGLLDLGVREAAPLQPELEPIASSIVVGLRERHAGLERDLGV